MSHQFFLGRCPLELAQGLSSVALALHEAGGSTPFGVTMNCKREREKETEKEREREGNCERIPSFFFLSTGSPVAGSFQEKGKMIDRRSACIKKLGKMIDVTHHKTQDEFQHKEKER